MQGSNVTQAVVVDVRCGGSAVEITDEFSGAALMSEGSVKAGKLAHVYGSVMLVTLVQ